MSVERITRKNSETVYRVRWRDQRGRNRSRVLGRKRDADAFDAEIRRRKRTGELALMDAGRETLDEYVSGTWAQAHAAHLAPRTRPRAPMTATSLPASGACRYGRSTRRRSPRSRAS